MVMGFLKGFEWAPNHEVPEEIRRQIVEEGKWDVDHWLCGGNCAKSTLERFVNAWRAAGLVFIPFHLIPFMVDLYRFRKNSDYFEQIMIRFRRRVWNWIRQASSASLGATVYIMMNCVFRNTFKQVNFIPMTLSGLLPGNIIAGLIESPGRRKETALYFFAKFLKAFHVFLTRRGINLAFRAIEIMAFSIAMSILCGAYQRKTKGRSQTVGAIFGVFLGEN